MGPLTHQHTCPHEIQERLPQPEPLHRPLQALAGEQLREAALPAGDLLRGADVRAPEVSGGPDLRKAAVWRARCPAAPGQSDGSRMEKREGTLPHKMLAPYKLTRLSRYHLRLWRTNFLGGSGLTRVFWALDFLSCQLWWSSACSLVSYEELARRDY